MGIYVQRPTRTTRRRFKDDGLVPNSAHPVVIYHKALVIDYVDRDHAKAEVNAIVIQNAWDARWAWEIYPFTHYHPDCHEMLAIVAGLADIELGGETAGEEMRLGAGDVILIPAGVGHRQIAKSADFTVVGAYPVGQLYSVSREPEDHDRAVAQIARVPLPIRDPLYGDADGITEFWR